MVSSFRIFRLARRTWWDRSVLSIHPALSCGTWMWIVRWYKCTASRAWTMDTTRNTKTQRQYMFYLKNTLYHTLWLHLHILYIGLQYTPYDVTISVTDQPVSPAKQAILEADQWSLSPRRMPWVGRNCYPLLSLASNTWYLSMMVSWIYVHTILLHIYMYIYILHIYIWFIDIELLRLGVSWSSYMVKN